MIKTIIPCGEMPKTRYFNQGPTNWLSIEEKSKFDKSPHASISANDVEYRFNQHGYRCDNFNNKNGLKIVSIGCSWTMGEGLPFENTYPEYFRMKIQNEAGIPCINWNLGLSGVSNDYICRTLVFAMEILKPDIVIVCFTSPSRREYISVDGKLYNLYNKIGELRGLNRKDNAIIKHYYGMTSAFQDQLNFFMNYKFIENLMEFHKTKWLFSSIYSGRIIEQNMNQIHYALDMEKFVAEGIKCDDFARDKVHPGVVSMKIFADALYRKYICVYKNFLTEKC